MCWRGGREREGRENYAQATLSFDKKKTKRELIVLTQTHALQERTYIQNRMAISIEERRGRSDVSIQRRTRRRRRVRGDHYQTNISKIWSL